MRDQKKEALSATKHEVGGPSVTPRVVGADMRPANERVTAVSAAPANLPTYLLNSLGEAVIACDLDGAITYCNPKASGLFGVNVDNENPVTLHSFIDFDNMRSELPTLGAWTGHIYFSGIDRRTVDAELVLSMVVDADGGHCGYVGVVHDLIDRHAAEQRVLEQNRRHLAVAELGHSALVIDDLQQLMDETVLVLSQVLDAPLCKVLQLREDGESLRLRAGVGWMEGLVGNAEVSAGHESQAGFTLLTQAPVLVSDLRTETRFSGPSLLSDHGVISGISVVILGPGDRPFGVLGAHTTIPRTFTEQDVNFFRSVANILAAAIRRDAVEQSLRGSEQRFRHLANAIPKIVWSANAEGVADYFNQRWYVCSGQTEGASGSAGWRAMLHPEDAPVWQTLWDECVAEGRSFEMEYRFYDTTAGDYRWHLGRAVPVRDPRGVIYRWYGSSTDIDDQKRTQHVLQAQARTLAMINWMNNALASQLNIDMLTQTVIDVGTGLIGAQFGVFLSSDDPSDREALRLSAMCGIGREVFSGRSVLSVRDVFGAGTHGESVVCNADITVDSDHGRNAPFNGVMPNGVPVRSYCAASIVSRSGDLLGAMVFGHSEAGAFVTDAAELIQGLASQAAIAVDNARLYRALSESEKQARRQLEQINAIYATAPVGLCFLDSELRFASMNDHLARMAGSPVRNVAGKTLSEVLGAAAPELERRCREVVALGRPILEHEICWRGPGQPEMHHWLCNCYPIRGDTNELLGINTVIQDITVRKQSELELAHLANIVAGSYDAIITESLDGTILSWNGGAESLYGYSADEAVGKNISLLLPGDNREGGAYILSTLQSSEDGGPEEAVRIRKDGQPVDVSMTVSPIHNAAREVVGVSTIERDVTLRKLSEAALRASEARTRFILDASRVGTWDWDIASGTVQWSDNMEMLHGRPENSFAGTFESVLADVHPDDGELIRTAVARAMEADGDYRVEYRIIRADDGTTRWIEGKGHMVRNSAGIAVRMAGICMDITERKAAEEALRVSESRLRDKAEELAIAHRQKDEFLAMLAHELRNPLAPIISSVQLLKLQQIQSQPEHLSWAIDVIDRQVGQITRLVDDLLDVARITRGRIELKRELIDIAEVVRHAIETVTPYITTKQHLLDVEYPHERLTIYADPTRLIQALSNLLNNAAKFTPEGGTIVFRIGREDRDIVLRIRDNGVGIAPDVLPHIFQLFVQEDRSLDRRQGGLGLGLSLAKRLVEMHNGRITASSDGAGRGSEFVIRLPLQGSADQPVAVSLRSDNQQPETSPHGLRILVVDDNAESAEALAMLLRTVGHGVETAYDGQSAITAAQYWRPQVVLLDIGLPMMDGYEVARRLRRSYGKEISLIALTGYTRNSDDKRVVSAGFDHYLLKPVLFDHLQSLLNDYQAALNTRH